jgi:hypothetical protein
MAKRRLESILALPDIHCPFEDKRAVRIVEDVAKAHKPNHIVISGDFLDGLNVSRHRKDPDLKVRFRDELDAGNALLDRIDALRPRGRKVFCAGNHESRLPNYIADNAPAFHGMLSIEGLLNLEKRGWEYVEYGDVAKIGKVRYTHDTGSAGAGAAQKSRTKVGGSTIIGQLRLARQPEVREVHGAGWARALAARVRSWVDGAQRDYSLPGGSDHQLPVRRER